MKYHIKNDLGEVIVDSNIIATFAGTAAVECFGIVGMASYNIKDGIVNLLKKERLGKGIKVTVEDNKISLEFHVIVSYGVSISTVTENLIESVKYKVEEFTGSPVDSINVFIEGVRVID